MIQRISPQQTIDLRHRILRVGRPIETCHIAGDSDPQTFHFGYILEERIIGIVSFYRKSHPELRESAQYQLRAMAVDTKNQGQAIGKKLVIFGLDHIKVNDLATVVWCHARSHAVGFYQKLGFVSWGEEFEIENVGPHFKMRHVHFAKAK